MFTAIVDTSGSDPITRLGSLDLNYGWRFDSHQHVIENGRPHQDYVWKLDLPLILRIEVLQRLNHYNLNAFSLFDSEESLLETMWLKELAFKDRQQ